MKSDSKGSTQSRQSAVAEEEPSLPKGKSAATWNRGYLFLSLALIPLVHSLLYPTNKDDVDKRLAHTLSQLSEQEQTRIKESFSKQQATLEDVVMALPGHRIENALLARESWGHWLYAAMAAGVFFVYLILAFPSNARPQYLLLTGLFTGTIGILLLL